MKIDEACIYSYSLSRKVALPRKGLIVKFIANGKQGFGEITPLKGFNTENLEEAYDDLLKSLTNPLDCYPISKLPSVNFGIESALLDLSLENNTTKLPLSFLLKGSSKQILDKASTLPNGSVAKVKLSPFSPDDAIKIVSELLKQNLRLRLDINQKWGFKEAMHFSKAFPDTGSFEYLEEPVSNLSELKIFTQESKHPIALDETIRNHTLDQIFPMQNMKSAILKPTMQGGISTYQKLIPSLLKKGCEYSFSSSFESSLGLYHITNLSKMFDCAQTPIGLDTFEDFIDNIIPIEKKDGNVIITKKPIDTSKLKLLWKKSPVYLPSIAQILPSTQMENLLHT